MPSLVLRWGFVHYPPTKDWRKYHDSIPGNCIGYYCTISGINWFSVWILANGFTMKPALPCCRNLRFSKLHTPLSQLLSPLKRAEGTDGVLEEMSLELEYRPSGFLRNLELKKSVGNMQQEVLLESVLVILPLVSAKSYEISSNAISKPCTRVSRERIPFCELPMNL